MTETPAERLFRQAEQLAYALGVPFYIRDGRICGAPPGERIEPAPGAQPIQHESHSVTAETGTP